MSRPRPYLACRSGRSDRFVILRPSSDCYLTPPQAAEWLRAHRPDEFSRVGPSTVTLWCRQGRLPGAYKPVPGKSNPWLIPVVALEQVRPGQRGNPDWIAASKRGK